MTSPVPLGRIAEALRRLPDQAKTWTRAAQREAWAEFKHRREYPGLAARFAQSRYRPEAYAFSSRARPRGRSAAYVVSGAMRDELAGRKLRIRVSAGAVVGRASLHARVLPLLAQKRGVAARTKTTEAVTYMLTTYSNSRLKQGPRLIPVTRSQTVWRKTLAARSYAQEWGWQPAELSWLRRRVEQLQAERVRKAAFDKKGNIRSRYASAFDGAPA